MTAGPHTLVVTAHPDPYSLTHRTAAALVDRLDPATTSVAHLAQEGFDPRFSAADRRAYLGQAGPGDDVLAEQRRVDAVEHVVLVFPVQWWSFPALLKGWVDRVFVAGWAFDVDADGAVVGRLGGTTLHLVPIAGASSRTWARRGYDRALDTQVGTGWIDFCGLHRGVTAFVHDADDGAPDLTWAAAQAAVDRVAASVRAGRAGAVE